MREPAARLCAAGEGPPGFPVTSTATAAILMAMPLSRLLLAWHTRRHSASHDDDDAAHRDAAQLHH